MGAQDLVSKRCSARFTTELSCAVMLPKTNAPMKATQAASARPMTKSAIAKTLAIEFNLKQKACSKLLDTLAVVGAKEMKTTGVFAIPSLCRFKTRTKPATKAGEKTFFGKTVMVKAKPSKKTIKAFPHAAVKRSI